MFSPRVADAGLNPDGCAKRKQCHLHECSSLIAQISDRANAFSECRKTKLGPWTQIKHQDTWPAQLCRLQTQFFQILGSRLGSGMDVNTRSAVNFIHRRTSKIFSRNHSGFEDLALQKPENTRAISDFGGIAVSVTVRYGHLKTRRSRYSCHLHCSIGSVKPVTIRWSR